MPTPPLSRRAFCLLPWILSGCGSYLPQNGPATDAVFNGASLRVGSGGGGERLFYALVRIDPGVLQRLRSEDVPSSFSPSSMAPPPDRGGIGVGDFVGVTIFEAGSGGLFIPSEAGSRSGNFVSLPPQQVDRAGDILVPFAGTIRVVGRSPQSVARTIQERLAGRALEPQAVVTVTERRSDLVSVTGDVNGSASFSLDPGGTRLLNALSRAGGPRFPPYESLLTLQRGALTESAFLSEVLRDPAQNIPLWPGDTVVVTRTPRYYLALGALSPGQYLGVVNRRLAFEDSRLTLAGAIARVGGLSDDRADARGVFVYRVERRTTLEGLGVPMAPGTPATIHTVYFVDLRDPEGYFYANQFTMRNDDLIFTSNSPSTDLAKFLALVLPVSYTGANFRFF